MALLYTYRVTWAGMDIPWHVEARTESAARARVQLLLGGRAVPADASFVTVGITMCDEPAESLSRAA